MNRKEDPVADLELVPVTDKPVKSDRKRLPQLAPDPWAHVEGNRGGAHDNPWVGRYDRRRTARL